MNEQQEYKFSLIEKNKPRKVYTNKDGLYLISSKNDTDSFKKTYNRFVPENTDSGIISRIRHYFNTLQAESFSVTPSAKAKLIAVLTTPAPHVAAYGNLLDIGCSTGIFLYALSPRWEKSGIEISEEAYEIAKGKKLNVKNVRLEKFYTSEKFDYVRACHVIEHVTDFHLFFKKSYDLMKKDGRLIIYTPNAKSLSQFLFKNYWEGFYDQTHFTIFNSENIQSIAKDHGFQTISQKTYDLGYLAASLIRLASLNNTAIGTVLFWLFLILFYPIGFIAGRLNYGDALYIEFKKS